MKILKSLSFAVFATASLLSLSACNSDKSVSSNIVYAQNAPQTEAGETLAKVNGESISEKSLLGFLEGPIKSQYLKVKSEFYATQSSALDEMVLDKLLDVEAKKQNTSKADLLAKEVSNKAKKVSDSEIKKFYDDYVEKMKGNPRFQAPPFDDNVKNQIRQSLEGRNNAERKQEYFNELTHKHEVTYYTTPPRIDVPTGELPAKGNDSAKVTIVEFSDFECPACRGSFETVEKVMKEYKGKVKLYFRDFPLSFHKKAKPAHNAARCANDQGKFWPYHDELFISSTWVHAADEAASIAELKNIAKKLKLDQAKFDACVDGKTHYAKIDEDFKAGQQVGVGGTPAFYVNGIPLPGAVPFEQFKKTIDAELARNKN
ncbi:MAG TPA: thioredoxin domain-containing protein [Oligoflexia bacterium]|nr:thioredoxin domain-containing protein [Oligoflexia bacterium]HMR25685.1 thioredoxin domain-containing protein [Oligoflexia bacterium]